MATATLGMQPIRAKAIPKLNPGWRYGRRKRRRAKAATMIQKCFRSYLLRKAFQAQRLDVRQSFAALRAFQHARDRKHWRSVDLHQLTREELRLIALSLNLPSTGKKVLLLCRIQRWIDQQIRVNDLAAQAAAKAQEIHVKAQGAVFCCEAVASASPVDIRPLRGKSITRVAAGYESDAVYAIDAARGAVWLCKTGGHASQVGLCDVRTNSDVFDPPLETRWLVNPVFLQVLRAEHVTHVQVARSHVVALAQAGELFAWGENPQGELGFPATSADQVARNRATVVTALANYHAVAVAVGSHHSAAVCDKVNGHDGVVFCWGSNTYGQLGISGSQTVDNGRFPRPFVMHRIESLEAVNVRTVACGALHTVALTAQGKLYSWGCSDGGRLGHDGSNSRRKSTLSDASQPTLIAGPFEGLVVLDVACGAWHNACIATADGSSHFGGRVFTWGTGIYGQLGAGNTHVLHEPREVCLPNEEAVIQVACGMHHTAALTAKNHVFSWGSTRSFHSSPRQLHLPDGSAFERIASIACGRTFTIFNTLQRDEQSYEGSEVHRLWKIKPVAIPPLDFRQIALLPLSSSCPEKDPRHAVKLRLEPAKDRAERERLEQQENERLEKIDIEALVHPLCRVCWRCDGFQPSPLKLWVCRQCFHDKELHGIRPKGARLGEYEAVRKLQSLYRAKRAKRVMERAREKHYQRIFSIKHDAFFYYNLWRRSVSWEWPPCVSSDADIPIRDPDELPVIKPPLTFGEATLIVQSLRRGQKARRQCQKRLEALYEKHFDFSSERLYYRRRDSPPGVKIWLEPALFKRLYSLGEPIEIQRLRKYANLTPDDAARVIQSLFRCYQARSRLRKILESRIKRILDETTGEYYYYNVVTKESTWDKPVLSHDKRSADIAPEAKPKHETERVRTRRLALVTNQSPIAIASKGSLVRKRRRRNRSVQMDETEAAKRIQVLVRGFQTRARLLDRISRRYRKHLDPATGRAYYYDSVAGVSSWIKPAILGTMDLAIADIMAEHKPTKKAKTTESRATTALATSHISNAIVPAPAPSGPRMSDKARRKREKRRLQKLRQLLTSEEAASRVQRRWRMHRAREQLKSLLADAYEKIYDPTTEFYYYYNTRTGEVRWDRPALLLDREVKEIKRVVRKRDYEIVEPQEAARVVLWFFQRSHARNQLHALLLERIQKVLDPDSQQFYYFDKRTGQSSWKKPVLLKARDLPVAQ